MAYARPSDGMNLLHCISVLSVISCHSAGSHPEVYLAQELKEQKEFYSREQAAKKENKDKVLIIFYCSSVAQVDKHVILNIMVF